MNISALFQLAVDHLKIEEKDPEEGTNFLVDMPAARRCEIINDTLAYVDDSRDENRVIGAVEELFLEESITRREYTL